MLSGHSPFQFLNIFLLLIHQPQVDSPPSISISWIIHILHILDLQSIHLFIFLSWTITILCVSYFTLCFCKDQNYIKGNFRSHKSAISNIFLRDIQLILFLWGNILQEIIDMCDFAVGLSRQLNGSVIPSERKLDNMAILLSSYHLNWCCALNYVYII